MTLYLAFCSFNASADWSYVDLAVAVGIGAIGAMLLTVQLKYFP